ncbi:MAG: hypothetical protein ACXVH7_07005, partial [Thermoanaerobaculia bacterium]
EVGRVRTIDARALPARTVGWFKGAMKERRGSPQRTKIAKVSLCSLHLCGDVNLTIHVHHV